MNYYRIRMLWPALVALGVCSALALGSCGRIETETSTRPTLTSTGEQRVTATTLALDTLASTPTRWSDFDLTKQADLQAEQDLIATARTYPTDATWVPNPPTVTLLPQAVGISTYCDDTRTYIIRSCWGQRVGDFDLGVASGYPRGDARQGVFMVSTIDFSIRDQDGAHPETFAAYPTHDQTGALIMLAIDLPHVTLRSEDGVRYVFNLDTRAYESSATPTPTTTPVGPDAFPATDVLDTFDRADGSDLGAAWLGNTAGYETRDQQLNGAGAPIYWHTSFGPDQEAFVRVAQIDPATREIDLLLKAQGPGECNLLEVWYQPHRHSAQVVTCYGDGVWTQQGADIPLTLAAGDVFGARARADGSVTVYQNGAVVGRVQVDTWAFADVGGQIGLWVIDQGTTRLDDFGGGAAPRADD